MSCGCDNTKKNHRDKSEKYHAQKGYEDNDRYGKTTKICKLLNINAEKSPFVPVGCCDIYLKNSAGKKCKMTTLDLLYKTNSLIKQSSCYSREDCVPACSYVAIANVTEFDYHNCCEKNKGQVAIFLYLCNKEDCCNGEEGNVVARAWFHFFFCNGEMVFKSADQVVEDEINCFPFELRKRCSPIHDCCGNLVTHLVSDAQNLIASSSCYCKYTGCGDLKGDFELLPSHEGHCDPCGESCDPFITGNINWCLNLRLFEDCEKCKH